MEDKILSAIHDAEQMEKLYRGDRKAFERAFMAVYPRINEHPLSQAWYFRLAKIDSSFTFGKRNDGLLLFALSLLGWLTAKIPEFTGLSEEGFFMRNIAFTVFPFLTLWFIIKGKVRRRIVWAAATAFIVSAIYINGLPDDKNSQTLVLACTHLVLFLWFVTGISFSRDGFWRTTSRLTWLRFNGDLAVMMAVLFLSGGVLSLVTIGLFEAAGISIESFYGKYVAIWGAIAIPLFGTWLVQTNPQMVGRVSPVIARVFTPLVVLMLTIYLTVLPFSGKDPFNDREFLLIFNVLLLGVMAIIFFALPGRDEQKDEKWHEYALLFLAGLTLIVNSIALSAIIYRIGEWGITPNRLAVLFSNALIFSNLILLAYKLLRVVRRRALLVEAENSIAFFIPIYAAWTAVVVFLFPVLFNFR